MLTKEQRVKLLTSAENFKQKMQTMHSAVQKNETFITQMITSAERFEKSLISLYDTLQQHLQNPNYRGTPTQKLMQAIEQTRNSIHKYVQFYTTSIPLTKEVEQSILSLITSMEAMSRWVSGGEVSTDPLLEYKCPSCHVPLQLQDTFCGNCGKHLFP